MPTRAYCTLIALFIPLLLACSKQPLKGWSISTIQSGIVNRSISCLQMNDNVFVAYDNVDSTSIAVGSCRSLNDPRKWVIHSSIPGSLNSPALEYHDNSIVISSIRSGQHTLAVLPLSSQGNIDNNSILNIQVVKVPDSGECLNSDIESHHDKLYTTHWVHNIGKLEVAECSIDSNSILTINRPHAITTRPREYNGHDLSIESVGTHLYLMFDVPYHGDSDSFQISNLYVAQLDKDDNVDMSEVLVDSISTSTAVVTASKLQAFNNTLAVLVCLENGDLVYMWSSITEKVPNMQWNSVLLEQNVAKWCNLDLGNVNGLPAIVISSNNSDSAGGTVTYALASREDVRDRSDFIFETAASNILSTRFWHPSIFDVNGKPCVVFCESNRATFSMDLKILFKN